MGETVLSLIPLVQTNRTIIKTGPGGHHSPVGLFLRTAYLVR
jgi:hypothetical protein